MCSIKSEDYNAFEVQLVDLCYWFSCLRPLPNFLSCTTSNMISYVGCLIRHPISGQSCFKWLQVFLITLLVYWAMQLDIGSALVIFGWPYYFTLHANSLGRWFVGRLRWSVPVFIADHIILRRMQVYITVVWKTAVRSRDVGRIWRLVRTT